ncbi:MAG: HlyD family efflux transporter periplasmic adaptor subunit [Gammaproteobacteria bacterium]|nr:HlyD family efflux transporter periplasmic adaptor subunit [Gammaproteobacteria bacterium]MBT7307962.1 HlyD family efflux transporter periplasmic adaptor subunit [Gammaproteobacteria bacterium]
MKSISTMTLLLFTLLTFLGWASWFELEQGVRAQGQVIASARTQIIQAADGGILSELLVQEGESVQAGQTLAVLEKSRVEAGYNEVLAKVISIQAGLIRVHAEVAGEAPEYTQQTEVDFSEYPGYVEAQRALYQQRKKGRDDQLQSLELSMQMAEEELKMGKELEKTGDISRLELLKARKQVNELQGKIASVNNEYLKKTRTEMAKLEEELALNRHKLAERKAKLAHTEMRTPIAGIVKYMRITTIGGVLKPGDELMQIAPSESEQLIEVKVNPADVGQLAPGLPATVSLEAFDYTIYGTLKGTLSRISPDTLTENGPNGGKSSYYRAQIEVPYNTNNQIGRASEIVMKLGMAATVDIRTGERSVLNYLIKPITRAFGGAMRER